MKKIYILDVTNRDGVQTSRLSLAKLEKTMINLLLNEMGIYQSEFGFPFTKHERNYLNANLELAKLGVLKPITLSGWCTVRDKEISTSFEYIPELKHINLSVSTSEQMIKGKFNKTEKDIIEMMQKAVKLAQEKGAEHIVVNAEDASRTRMAYLLEFFQAAKDAGAKRIRYCDTLGYDGPLTTYARVKAISEKIQLPMELHCHGDLGMAVACSVAGARAAIDAGVDAYVNTTVNAIGERAGNADLLSCLLAMKFSSDFEGEYRKALQDVDLKKAWELAHYASAAFGVPIPVNQPGVGANAFAHESGIHADGALKDRRNYELYDHEALGRKRIAKMVIGREITTGEYSGLSGFKHVYENLGVTFNSDEEAQKVLELVRYANIHKQKPVTEKEFLFIAKYPDIAKMILTIAPDV